MTEERDLDYAIADGHRLRAKVVRLTSELAEARDEAAGWKLVVNLVKERIDATIAARTAQEGEKP